MTLTLYRTTSEAKDVNKVLTTIGTYNAEPIVPTSMTAPAVYITLPESTSGHFPGGNYAYIAEWNRYYYMDPPVWLSDGVWQVQLRCDVLMSHRAGIRAQSAYVARAASEYDTELSDTAAPTKVSTKMTTVVGVPYGFDDALSSWCDSGNIMYNSDAVCVLGLDVSYFTYVGSEVHQFPREGLMYICCTYGAYRQLMERLKFYSASWLADKVVNYDLFTNMVKSVYMLPYAPKTLGTVHNLYIYSSVPEAEVFNQSLPLSTFGNYYVVDHSATPTFMWRVPVDMDIEFPYRNTSPFREISCEFWPLGVCSLDTSVMTGLGDPRMYVCIWCETSSLTGQTQFYYGALAEDDNFSLSNVKAKCRLPLGQTNVKYDLPIEGGQGNNVRIISSAAAAISGGMDVGDYGKKNPTPPPPKSFTTMSNIAKGAGALAAGWEWASSSMYPPSSFSVSGNVTTTLVSASPRLLIMSKEQLDIPESLIGRPLFQVRTLGDLSGFVQVQDVHVEGITGAFLEEVQEIESLLRSGVYM